jgi:hypothetical protein
MSQHTYLYFIKESIEKYGRQVFFYNPKFPGIDSYDEVIKD